jgi:hypothetical protein
MKLSANAVVEHVCVVGSGLAPTHSDFNFIRYRQKNELIENFCAIKRHTPDTNDHWMHMKK